MLVVLGRDNHGIQPHRASLGVFNGDLALAIRSQPFDGSGFALFAQISGNPVRDRDRHRHQLRRLVAGESDHHALIAGSGQSERIRSLTLSTFEGDIDAFLDVRALLADADDDITGIGINPERRIGVADFPQRLPGNGFESRFRPSS